jgi:hypothetical protein
MARNPVADLGHNEGSRTGVGTATRTGSQKSPGREKFSRSPARVPRQRPRRIPRSTARGSVLGLAEQDGEKERSDLRGDADLVQMRGTQFASHQCV